MGGYTFQRVRAWLTCVQKSFSIDLSLCISYTMSVYQSLLMREVALESISKHSGVDHLIDSHANDHRA